MLQVCVALHIDGALADHGQDGPIDLNAFIHFVQSDQHFLATVLEEGAIDLRRL